MDFKPNVKIVKRETHDIFDPSKKIIAETETHNGQVTRIYFVDEDGKHTNDFAWLNYADAGYRLQVNGNKELSPEQVKILAIFLGHETA